MKHLAAIISLSLISLLCSAEIYKVAIPDGSCGTICFYWWPVLPKVDGWEQDMPSSYHYGVNAQAPSGESFAAAESVIYAKALYKPRMPEIKSLEQLIKNDQREFKKHSKLTITQVDSINTSDGKEFKSFRFFPKGSGNYERVSYGEEGEFYLVFTLSSRSEKGYKSSMPAYIQFISQYRENPNNQINKDAQLNAPH